ncbi:MAG: lysine--tRNA ligase [Planctomycetota bacterium]
MTDHLAEDRLPKLERLREAGIDPFPARTPQPTPIDEAKAVLNGLDPEATADGKGPEAILGGRLTQIRDFGKLRFAHLMDRSGSLQIGFERDQLQDFWPNRKLVEPNDHVVIRGVLGFTNKGEPTLWAREVCLASKSLRHAPEKWAGLQDVEQRIRQRSVDLVANPEVREIFKLRSKVLRETRNYFDSLDYLEVETPILQPIFGGATARPFSTHHNALDMPLFLRIAPELYLKRLLVGGLERVYEIGRVFRNEGISTRHNPEFTMLESYEAWADYKTVMARVEGLFEHLCETVLDGRTKVGFRGHELELKPPFQKKRYLDLFQEHNGGLDWFDADGVTSRAKELGLKTDGVPAHKLANDVFEETCEKHLIDPVFVYDYPEPICPLAKTSADDPRVAERFELFFAGMEMGNAFSELNDPIDQERKFREQLEHIDDESPSEMDEDYVASLEFGMPPAGGLGIGIDRLVMLLSGTDSIREVVLFPLLRRLDQPASDQGSENSGDDESKAAGAES